jgi:uncharacterized protein YbjT (DUF2867 family)
VTGATGKQGGAVARSLLAQGAAVRALVRDPHAPAAERLKTLGADLVRGDFTDRDSLLRTCAGVRAVFSVPSPRLEDPAAERPGDDRPCDLGPSHRPTAEGVAP